MEGGSMYKPQEKYFLQRLGHPFKCKPTSIVSHLIFQLGLMPKKRVKRLTNLPTV